MSVIDTIVLDSKDLRFLLIDSLRQYSSNVIFIDGNNPYRFSINKKEFYILIRNVHESGKNRDNPDECRIQVNETNNFNSAIRSRSNVIVLGYLADKKVFTAWDPDIFRDRFNKKATVSAYSRFSVLERARSQGFSIYEDSNQQRIISLKPDYLGLYLDNVTNIHQLNEAELLSLIIASDKHSENQTDGAIQFRGKELNISHARYARDPGFRKKVYEAYDYRCAMCGIQLQLVEAAHIVPHSHEKGTDDISNGICLCALHHAAYDRSLIYFVENYKILNNDAKLQYLTKIKRDSGLIKLQQTLFSELELPGNHASRPNIENIHLANEIRGIYT